MRAVPALRPIDCVLATNRKQSFHIRPSCVSGSCNAVGKQACLLAPLVYLCVRCALLYLLYIRIYFYRLSDTAIGKSHLLTMIKQHNVETNTESVLIITKSLIFNYMDLPCAVFYVTNVTMHHALILLRYGGVAPRRFQRHKLDHLGVT